MDGIVAVLLVIALVTLVVVASIVRSYRKKIEKLSQEQGVQWLGLMRSFLEKIQKHRGLSTAYINGTKENLSALATLEEEVNESIYEIENAGRWIRKNERWMLIVEHWKRLEKSALKTNDADNNLLQHTKMIQNTLYLVEDMADEHSLFELRGDQQKSIEFLWRDLLHAIEYLGQARAIGSGITAKRKCSSVERIRMNYLYQKIQESCLSINHHLPNADIAEREVGRMLNTIEEHILSDRCDINTRQYFDLATKTIEFLYGQYDSTLTRVAKM